MTRRDDDMHDAWMDTALEEKLGGAAPPDLGSHMAPRDRAIPSRIGPGRRLAAAAVVLLGLAVIVAVRALRDTGDDVTGTPQDPEPRAPVRVLYVEALPRWEFRYLRNLLLRDRGIGAQVFLLGAAPSFVQAHSEGLPALESLPSTAAQLAAYDVVILGDLAPENVGRTEEERAAWVQEIAAFVRGGGGLAFLCGSRAMPEAWRDTALVQLLPTELEEPPLHVEPPDSGVAPQLTEAGIHHPVLQLAENPLETGQVLCDVRFHQFVTLGPAREGGAVLALGPGQHPLIAVGSAGKGRTFVIATEETWRLRNPHGDRYHGRLWSQVVHWLAGRER